MIYSFQRTLVSTRLSALTNSTTHHLFSSQLLQNILPSFFYLSNEGFFLLKTKKILLSLHLSQSLFGSTQLHAFFLLFSSQHQFSSVQSLSCVRLFATPWTAACQASLSITNSWSSPRLMCIESVMPSSRLILCHPLLLLPPIPPSIRVFYNESALHRRWPNYWSFSLSISPSKEHPSLMSFRMDWLDILTVLGMLKTLFQHHISKASILRRSAFFTVQLSYTHMTTGKTIALTRRTFVGKVISLLFNILSMLVITFQGVSIINQC